MSASWDCTIKSFEYSDGQLDENSEEIFHDNENQITQLATNSDESIIACGDIEGKLSLYTYICEIKFINHKKKIR